MSMPVGLAVKMADETVRIGPPQAAKFYLDIDAILSAAKETGADAVAEAGLTFGGPSGDTIQSMGDKAAAGDDGRSIRVADEVQTGFARTGKPFAMEHQPRFGG